MKRLHIFSKLSSSKGQSLVEVALFFPIFIMMLAGLVEVANILVTQNRVTSAARSSTRFAADGGENAGMTTVLLNTVTQTLQLNEDVWDVWAVRGTINADGTAILDESWEFTHIYGISLTADASDVDEDAVRAQVLDELQRDENGDQYPVIARDLQFVGTFAIHDIDSILGLNAVPQLVGFKSVKELAVMRVLGFSQEATDGCDAFPIAIDQGARSVTAPGSGGADTYPAANQFNFPLPASAPQYANFVNHEDNVPLLEANEGYVYKFDVGEFGWLRWNTIILDSAANLNARLTWPGNSRNYTGNPVAGFLEALDPSDNTIHKDDWVASTINTNPATFTILNGHITNARTLRMITYESPPTGGNYLIKGFAVFKIVGYRMSGGGNWVLAEFVRWDESCGQVSDTP